MPKKVEIVACLSGILLLILLSACAAGSKMEPKPDVEKLPYNFQLDFSSQLPVYVVPTQGPIDAHQRYRFNEKLEKRLRALLSARSAETSDAKVVVTVHVLALKFDYEEIGGIEQPVLPKLAVRGLFLPGGMSALKEDDGGMDIPYETVKTAVIRFRISVRQGDRKPVTTEFSEKFTESVMWDDMRANWPYDYHTFDRVIAGVVDKVVNACNRTLEENFSL